MHKQLVIVKAILEIEDKKEKIELREVDIIINCNLKKLEESLLIDETTLADLISDETGYCVQEIIGYKEPDYIIEE